MGKYSNFSTPEGAHLGYHPPTGEGSMLYCEYILQIFLFFSLSLLHLCVYAHTHAHQSYINHRRSTPLTHICICVCITKVARCSVLYAFCFDLVI